MGGGGGLAERLRAETRVLHSAAERSAFMGALLRGRLQRPAYAALLRNLQAIYAALESALDRHCAHRAIAPIRLPGLARGPAIAADLHAIGAHGADPAALEGASLDFAARLRELDAGRPALLLAHAYVRYLGDLNGGQRLREFVAASPGIAAGGAAPTGFYEFGDGAATAALLGAFRAALASVPVDAAEVAALVEEAQRSFRLHLRLFDELALRYAVR